MQRRLELKPNLSIYQIKSKAFFPAVNWKRQNKNSWSLYYFVLRKCALGAAQRQKLYSNTGRTRS